MQEEYGVLICDDVLIYDDDDVYELGCTAAKIDCFLRMDHPSAEISELKSTYFVLQGLASRLSIELARQIPEETKTEHEKRKFFQNQIDCVEADIMRQSCYIRDMFSDGKVAQRYFCYMRHAKDLKTKLAKEVEEDTDLRKQLRECIAKVQLRANKKGIDINEELNKGKTWLESEPRNFEEFEQLKLQLKRKLCKGKQVEEKRSEIDPSRFITNDHWVISLVRLPDSSKEHAFLVLEGRSDNTWIIWFADFVANDASDLLCSGVRDGKVRVIGYHEEPGSSEKLLFRCSLTLMKIREGDHLLHSTWQIRKSTGEVLVRNLKTRQDNPPKYNILGNTMLAGSSATSSSNPTGHNCFTFAKKVLHDLRDDYIEIPEKTLDKWMYSATSRYLVDKQPNNQRSDMLGFRGIFVALVATAVLLLKLFNNNK